MARMAKTYKCKLCKSTVAVEDMITHDHIVEKSGNKLTSRYCKDKCYDIFIEAKKFKDQEAIEMQDLFETITRIHQLDCLPSSFFSVHLQPLRGGFYKMGGKAKKYKGGIPYTLMKESYLFCEKSINYYRETKEFSGALNELTYCFTIVVDKLPVVKKKLRREEVTKVINAEKVEAAISYKEDNREFKFKKKSNGKADISRFLD